MGLRTRLSSFLRLDEASQQRAHALEAEVQALRTTVAGQADELARLDKRLGMAMGAIQAATAQIMTVKQTAEEARSEARQAAQKATSATATAESVAAGLEAFELAASTPKRRSKPAPRG